MRRLFPSAVLFAGVLWIAWAAGVERLAAQQNGSAPAQSQNAAQEPDAPQPQSDATPAPGAANAPDAPQPQNNPPKKQKNGQKPGSGDPAQADQTADPQATPGDANGSAAAGSDNSGQSAKPSSAADDNPFPEDVSRKAAQADGSSGSSDTPPPQSPNASPNSGAKPSSAADDNPFPEDVSRKAAEADGSSGSGDTPAPQSPNASPNSGGKSSPAADNPFPEGVSRKAADQAAHDASPSGSGAGASSLPSANSNLEGAGKSSDTVTSTVRAKEDTQVGDFYLVQGDVNGAYIRYQEAAILDPTNMDAVYGLAEAAMRLKKYSEAEHNYELYLQVVPTGSKAKHALKQLDQLARGK